MKSKEKIEKELKWRKNRKEEIFRREFVDSFSYTNGFIEAIKWVLED